LYWWSYWSFCCTKEKTELASKKHQVSMQGTWGHITHLNHIGKFSNVNTIKNGYPYCGPILPLGAMVLFESFYVILNFSGAVDLGRKIFKDVAFGLENAKEAF
jgi:hypothetical protein